MILDELEAALVAVGPNTIIGGSSGWISAKGKMPAKPDKVVCLHEASGEGRSPSPDRPKLEWPRFQIEVRGDTDLADASSYAVTRAKLQACIDALHLLTGQTLSGTLYPYILAEGGVLSLGPDENNRPVLTQNFRCTREA